MIAHANVDGQRARALVGRAEQRALAGGHVDLAPIVDLVADEVGGCLLALAELGHGPAQLLLEGNQPGTLAPASARERIDPYRRRGACWPTGRGLGLRGDRLRVLHRLGGGAAEREGEGKCRRHSETRAGSDHGRRDPFDAICYQFTGERNSATSGASGMTLVQATLLVILHLPGLALATFTLVVLFECGPG